MLWLYEIFKLKSFDVLMRGNDRGSWDRLELFIFFLLRKRIGESPHITYEFRLRC
jgi:hypothetical protein